jgi:hypothetical protein
LLAIDSGHSVVQQKKICWISISEIDVLFFQKWSRSGMTPTPWTIASDLSELSRER